MSLDDIRRCRSRISPRAIRRSFCGCVDCMLPEALAVGAAWGFVFKPVALLSGGAAVDHRPAQAHSAKPVEAYEGAAAGARRSAGPRASAASRSRSAFTAAMLAPHSLMTSVEHYARADRPGSPTIFAFSSAPSQR